jgi:thymidylate synthase (FAD)
MTEDMLSDDITVEISNEHHVGAESVVMLALQLYDKAIANGVKPENARRIIPQGALTQVWSSWLKPQFDDMIELRSAAKAQLEIRILAKSMSGLVERL